MNIKPFNAIWPEAQWLTTLASGGKQELIRSFLEPDSQQPLSMSRLAKNVESMELLIQNGNYQRHERPAFYLYEQQDTKGSAFGIWTLTSVADLVAGKVRPHEQTLDAQVSRLQLYGKVVGIEATPVVFTYYREAVVCEVIELVACQHPDYLFEHAEITHRLWRIADSGLQERLQRAFANIPSVCIADGHHRVAAAQLWQSAGEQWISSIYVSTGQLRCKPFHRIVIPGIEIQETEFFDHLRKHFKVCVAITITDDNGHNEVFRPQRRGQFGLYFRSKWYVLERMDQTCGTFPDVSLLQEQVLAPFFGIHDPSRDDRLQCWTDETLEERFGLVSCQQSAIVFILYPLAAGQLLELAEEKKYLPPKSTFIEPRLPYGLMLYQNQTQPLCASSKYPAPSPIEMTTP